MSKDTIEIIIPVARAKFEFEVNQLYELEGVKTIRAECLEKDVTVALGIRPIYDWSCIMC